VIGTSESDCGSDPASIRTRATRNASGDWVVNGAEVWTSNAHISHYSITLVRTDPPGEVSRGRHQRLTQLLLGLSTRGITINPIRILDGGHNVNEVVFDDVVVPGDVLLDPAPHRVRFHALHERPDFGSHNRGRGVIGRSAVRGQVDGLFDLDGASWSWVGAARLGPGRH
jgi:hypothetical protein